MIKKYFLLLFFSGFSMYGQGEANNWFFGNGAGMHFDANGNVTSLPNGQVFTTEGCSSISNANGDLLFYTDGRTVWDRNHIKMPNGDYFAGKGLFGDPSSTQSGIIVPKPNDPNIYYIFTVDEPHHDNAAVYPVRNTAVSQTEDDGFNNGFNYSVVNLSLTGSNGSVGNITQRNRHLITYDTNPNGEEIKYKCSEKITAVRDGSGGYWVITQFVNRFYAFRVTSAGVTETPVVSVVEPYITTLGYRRNAIGYLKASPNGQKLALAHSQNGTVTGQTSNDGSIYLYDFDKDTGIVSNPVPLKLSVNPYGIEFSAETKKLYANMREGTAFFIMQFDLEQSNIAGTGTVIAINSNTGALQLGPNKKIYFTNAGENTLGVINNPEGAPAQVNYDPHGVTLAYGIASLGLPPFITSVFYPSFQANNTCLGDTTTFTLPPSFQSQVGTGGSTIAWDFGDSTAISNATEPTHVYGAAGNYQVTVTMTINGDQYSNTQDITIHEVPSASPANALELCDTDHDGVMTIDLTQQNNAILNGQNPATFEVRYFTSQADANTNTGAINATAFVNTTAAFTIYARVQNRNNSACYALTDFNVTVTAKPEIVTSNDYTLCDDNTANGIQTFNLASLVSGILGTQNPTDYNVSFHLNQADADTNASPLPGNYTNVVPNDQEIFIRLENKLHPGCYSTKGLHLIVNALPVAVAATLVQCDFGLNPDGFTTFNLNEANAVLTNGTANLTTTFFDNLTDATNNTNPLPVIFTNTTNPQQLSVRVTNPATGCYTTTTLELQVTLTPTQRYELNACSDTAYAAFTLTDSGLETPGTDVRYYATLTDALLEQNELTTTFSNTVPTTQVIYARIESNNDCSGIHEIKLNVRPLPVLANDFAPVLCAGTSLLLSAGLTDVNRYEFLWSTGATSATISVNTAAIYTVKVTDKLYGCSATRTITVIASDRATITGVEVVDLTENNTITVYASGTSDHYIYALDSETGPYQDSNVFTEVEAGVHMVYVKDYNGCGVVKKQVAVLGIPKFFTPNGDGYNDLWRIKGATISPYKDGTVSIFDRYGKLVYQMKASGGWDGLYNREPLPSTDYWYVLSLPDGRVVKGHFSMKR